MLALRLVVFMVLLALAVTAKQTWLRPGCHKVGHTRKIAIPECVEFQITTNACRGFCESYAVPSAPWAAAAGLIRPVKPVVSVGQCCNIIEAEEVQKRVLCMGGMRNFTFQSAVSCSCYHCKKE